MKVTLGPSPEVEFTVEIEVDGVTVRVHGLRLISEIGAVALRHHPTLFRLVQEAAGAVPVDVEAKVEARLREELRMALFPFLEPPA